MNSTPIQWCDYTTNPFMAFDVRTEKRGWFCEIADPSCVGCYARALNTSKRGFGNGLDFIPENAQYVRWEINWKEIESILRRKKPCKVFPFDMIDLFHRTIPDEMIDVFFAVVALKPELSFQVLTKRIERAREYLASPGRAVNILSAMAKLPGMTREKLDKFVSSPPDWPLPNLWLGTSYGRHKEAVDRLPILLQCDAAVRFVSYEPAIEYVDPRGLWHFCPEHDFSSGFCVGSCPSRRKLDWMIIGGMSGPHAKRHPFDYQWAVQIVGHAKDAGISLFVKQMGANFTCNGERIRLVDGHGGNWDEWPEAVRVRQFPAVRS